MTLAEHIRAMPRATRWALAGLAAVAAYFAVVEPVLDYRGKLEGQAQAAEARLAAYRRETEERREAAAAIERGESRFTKVAFPGEADRSAEELNRRVNEVLDANGIRERTLRSRGAPLGTSSLDKVLRPTDRIDRRIIEIQFEASPEQAAAALAGLEQSPEVTNVSRVQLDRSPNGRMVRASFSVEAWVRVPKGEAR
jgi:hypothetical protein